MRQTIKQQLATVKKQLKLLKQEMADDYKTSFRMAKLLDGVCDALKGKPPKLTLYSWHDLPKIARQKMKMLRELQNKKEK
jgi:hypothetical protein